MNEDFCSGCKYWHRYVHNDTSKGECRVGHPEYVKKHKVAGKFPETKEGTSACGEFKKD